MVFRASFKPNRQLNLSDKPNRFGGRHVQAILLFFGMVFSYWLRVNISAAIVPMTQPTAGAPHYDWNLSTKSLILSSFFWGYVAAQIPSGMLAKCYGGKIVLAIATILASIITIFHPLAVSNGSWKILIILRVFVGFLQGVVYPCVHTLLAKWVPSTERSFLGSAVYSGAQLGSALVLGTSGFIFESSLGWPSLFYISGAITLIWSIIFLICGCDSPAQSKVISKEEREYIERLTGGVSGSHNVPVPWKSLFTSLPFFGLIAAQAGFTWGFYTLLTEIPSYMNHVLQLNVKSNALLSSLPYFAMWIMCLIISPISDFIINHNYLSVTHARKLFNSIGLWVPMLCLIGLGYMTQDEKVLAITLLVVGVAFNAAAFSGYLVNHMDLSPNFAGSMMSVSNCFGNVLSLLAPLIVGLVISNEEDPSEWRIVFFITSAIYLFCNLCFLIIGDATVQPWNEKTVSNSKKTLPHNVEHIPDSKTHQTNTKQ